MITDSAGGAPAGFDRSWFVEGTLSTEHDYLWHLDDDLTS